MAQYLFLREELPIFVGYSQINNICRLLSTKFYYCFRFFAPGMYDTSYLIMQHLGAGHFFHSDLSFREIPAILYPRSITTDILE